MRIWQMAILMLWGMFLLCACQTTRSGPEGARSGQSLQKLLSHPEVISLPYALHGEGVYAVEVSDGTGTRMPFLIDTGATRSAVFTGTMARMGWTADVGRTFVIHGMLERGDHPSVSIPEFRLGSRVYENFSAAVLETREADTAKNFEPWGILGMDVMREFKLFVSAETRTIHFIPNVLPQPVLPNEWSRVSLKPNPFSPVGRDLHFLDIRLGNILLPALLDTGSEFNLMSWSVDKFPALNRVRRKLYKQWTIEGAVGEFEPLYRVKAEDFRSGQKYWGKGEFLVMNLSGLDILGITNKPVLIAGAPLFSGQTFYLDFDADFISFKPNPKDRSSTNKGFSLEPSHVLSRE